MTWARRTAMAAVLIVLGGCGGQDSRWTGTVRDSAGVRIVENPSDGMWNESSRWGWEELLVIGTAEGNPDYQFGNISGIAVDALGRIYVLDQQASHIRAFDAEGQYVATFSGPGNGPGEIGQGAGPILLGNADTLIVPDLANQRVALFNTEGESYGSYRLSFEDGIPVRWESTPLGLVVTQVRGLALPNMPAPDSMDALVARAADGSIVDTLMKVPAGKTFSMSGGTPEFNFFSAEPAWAMAPEMGIFYGVNNEYRIGRYDSEGRLSRLVTKSFERQPVTDADKNAFLSLLENAWKEAGVPQEAVGMLKSRVKFADFYPAYLQMLAGPAETLWVQHIQAIGQLTEEERRTFNPLLTLGTAEWDVFDAEGRFLGTLSMPDRFQPVRFLDDRVYGIWRDDLDVQYVMGLRITGVSGTDTGDVTVGE